MTPEYITTYELVTNGGLFLGAAVMWVMERRWRCAAQRREKTEFDARLELVVEKNLEIGILRKRIEGLEEALRGHPYSSRNAPAAPTTCDPLATRPTGYGYGGAQHPPNVTPPPPTMRFDG